MRSPRPAGSACRYSALPGGLTSRALLACLLLAGVTASPSSSASAAASAAWPSLARAVPAPSPAPPPAGHAAPAPPAPAPAPGATYAVRLARTFVVGQKQLVTGSLETDDLTSGGAAGAEKSQHDSGIVRYVVVAEALEVSPRGNVQRARLTVRRLFKESGGLNVELAAPGDELRAFVDGRRHVVVSRGAEMAPDLMEALGAAAALRSDDDPTDDDLFGTPERRAVGASWPASTGIFARAGSQQLVFDPRNVTGTVTLAGLRTIKGVPCLEVRWKLDAHHGSFRAGAIPGGLLGTMSVMSISGTAVVPVDPALQPAERQTDVAGTGDFTGATETGNPLTLHRQLHQKLHLEIGKVP
jgi:hypothetical protein